MYLLLCTFRFTFKFFQEIHRTTTLLFREKIHCKVAYLLLSILNSRLSEGLSWRRRAAAGRWFTDDDGGAPAAHLLLPILHFIAPTSTQMVFHHCPSQHASAAYAPYPAYFSKVAHPPGACPLVTTPCGAPTYQPLSPDDHCTPQLASLSFYTPQLATSRAWN